MSRNLVIRIAVAAFGIPAILWICYQGGWWLFGMLGLMAFIATIEILKGEQVVVSSPLYWVTIVTICLLFYLFSLGLSQGPPVSEAGFAPMPLLLAPGILLAYMLVVGMGMAMGKESPSEIFGRYTRLTWAVMYLGFLYPIVFGIGSGAAVMTAGAVSGGDSLLYLFSILWVGDTAAMGIGSWIGKHKLAPTVSPNKTVEGFIGGIAGALLVGVLMIFWKFSAIPWHHVLALAFGCSVFGQLGDLVESMWKRSHDLKDSSAIIPGHGGVLDRFDSLLFAAPFMYFYLLIIR